MLVLTYKNTIFLALFFSWTLIWTIRCYDEWNDIACEEEYQPENCDFNKLNQITVDDFDRCAPARLPLLARNYFLGASGRRQTYKENKNSFRRISIIPKLLRDLSVNDMKTTILRTHVDFPIGHSPVGIQGLANPDGELATVEGLSSMKTIMIMSSFATTPIEEVARMAFGTQLTLWMQTYIFHNRSVTIDIVKRAERSGFKGIVVTADANIHASVTCNTRTKMTRDINLPNIGKESNTVPSAAFTFSDIKWLKTITKLPIIVKGILSGDDATQAIMAGASAILVSNHGGRQLDGDPATIDALPGVVDAVARLIPRREVYMDGGVRSGTDVYKAIARGAKMVFVGRPIIWGLAVNGSDGVEKVMTILKKEFNETMLLSGNTNPSYIKRNTLLPEVPNFGCYAREL